MIATTPKDRVNQSPGCTPVVEERVLTIDELSKMFNVSTKTVSRWRNEGLESGTFEIGGRKRRGFLQSSVNNFVRLNPGRVRRGMRFSHLTDQERSEIIDQARRLACEGQPLTSVIKQLASESGRSVETIRYTIKDHDKQHPDRAVFGATAITNELKRAVYQRYLGGEKIDWLAKRFGRPKAAIVRVIREMRMARVMELPLQFMHSPDFEAADAESQITCELPKPETQQRKPRVPAGIPAYLASLYETPLLTADQEVHLFRKYNYLKYRASSLREQLDPAKPKKCLIDEIERLYKEAVAAKNQIIQANLRLVVSVVKKKVSDNSELFDLISDGNSSLMRAVEKFDYTRGFKFSTYATWAIKKNAAREYAAQTKLRDRFKTGKVEVLMDRREERPDVHQQELAQDQRKLQVTAILKCLNERERQIIVSRFGLDPNVEPMTLKDVGDQLGVSKERIRQIEGRAIQKLRKATDEAKLDFRFDE